MKNNEQLHLDKQLYFINGDVCFGGGTIDQVLKNDEQLKYVG